MKLRLPFDGWYTISTKYGAGGHLAVDFECPEGTPILASHDGVLTYESTELGGRTAKVTGVECYTRYCHLLGYWVNNGQQVKMGDEIALSDNTGTPYRLPDHPDGTTGPHLHWSAHLLDGTPFNPLLVLGESKMKKTFIHFENAPSEDQRKRLAASNFKVVKSVWPFPAIPGKVCISRHWIGGDGAEGEYIRQGKAGAQALYARMKPLYQQYPGLYWEPWNEPDTSSLASCKLLCEFGVEYARLMHADGFLMAGPATGEGRPEDNPDSTSAAKTAALGPLYMAVDLITFHGYYCPPQVMPDDPWHTVRYRKIKADLAAAGFFPTAKWVETEAEIDRGVIAGSGGYKNIPITQEQYLPYIQQHDAELCKDDYILGCTIFTVNPNPSWVSFDIGGWLEDQIYLLAEAAPDDLLVWAETIVIPFNPNAALSQYIDVKGWLAQSQEMSHDGIPYQWGRHKINGVWYRTFIGWINGQVVEVTTVKN